MAEKVTLRAMKCPNCGASLKAENGSDTIVCVYCGDTIVPVFESNHAPAAENSGFGGGFGGTIRVEGIKTSASALAYIEQFFEDYDWDAFAYAQTLSVGEIGRLVDSLKVSSADDKNTWFACFKAACVPFIRKAEGCRRLLTSAITEYQKDNLDAYSTFDAYKRVASLMVSRQSDVLAKLEKCLTAAAKYGATTQEIDALRAEMAPVRDEELTLYRELENVPEIKAFKAEKNARIVARLAARGIDAAAEYQRAKDLMAQKKYVEALNVLCALEGYSNTEELIDMLDRYYLISDVLEIEGVLYFFQQESGDSDTYALYRTAGGKIEKKPFIKDIGNIITNYADILYYINGHGKLCRCYLSTGAVEVIGKTTYYQQHVYLYNRKVYLVTQLNKLSELVLSTGVVTALNEDIRDVLFLKKNKLVYTKRMVSGENTYTVTCVMNLDTRAITDVGSGVKVEGFVEDYVVYTQVAPNENNLHLYVKSLSANLSPMLVEKNIYRFCDVIAGKLFYYIGNSTNQCLIHINCDGTGRREWPLYIHKVLFEQGGWVYFIRRSGYNSILCKSRLDGEKFSVIARDIEEFVEIKNGYLYYVNDDAALVKVRMDGSNLQTLCDDVEQVLTVKEDKIVFVSTDDRIRRRFGDLSTVKNVKSIYAVDFSGRGKSKLVYDVDVVQKYDDSTIYYLVERWRTAEGSMSDLYRLNIHTQKVEKLLEVEKVKQKSYGWLVALCLFLVAAVVALIGYSDGNQNVGFVGLIVAIISLFVAAVAKSKNT